nr:MAG: ORF2 [Anelloviridae sp.]UJQ88107.1 MAG: ORF2 [Anelloviridae sp.]
MSSQGKAFKVMAFNASLGQDEDRWKLVIQTTHMLFCDCGDYVKHLQNILGPKWLSTSGEEEDTGDQGGAEGATGEDPTDQLLAAALDAAEELGGGRESG